MPTDTEKGSISLDIKEVSEEGVFEGYASKFGEMDQGQDVVVRGAFSKTLKSRSPRRIKMLWQHDPSSPVGTWEDLQEDNVGLRVRGRLLTSLEKGREAYELMKAGILDGLSIGYRTIKATRDERTGSRELKELELWEISLVTFPMLQSAMIDTVKGDWTKRDVERVLRDAGMPGAMAVKLIAGGWNTANTSGGQGDPGKGDPKLMEEIRQLTETVKRRMK